MGSIPRLLPGQGAILAAGAIDYPAEFLGVAPEVRASLGISKVMTLTCTYDHRIIQGAESGMFLGKIQQLLEGLENFYEEVFAHLKMPHQPVRWAPDRQAALPGLTGQRAEAVKEVAVIQLINAYRVRGHLIADLDPLGVEPSYHPSPSGTSTANSSPARLAKRSERARRSQWPLCARVSKPCAARTAARSGAST